MNAVEPPKQKRRLYGTALRKLLLRRGCHFSRALQPLTERSRVRHCVACGARVRNKNLVWIGAGVHDPIIPTTETKRLAALLRDAGADVTMRYFQAGHELTPADVEAARDWLTVLR